MRCPNEKAFHLQYRQYAKGNQYGRQEEVYQCEDCSGCPYAERCKKTDKNRTVRINRELTAMNQEVIENLESIADGYLDVMDVKHYVIVTMNYNIDIISEGEPEIEIKS